MATGEVWLPIPGYEGSYDASDRGRIRSLDRTIIVRNRWGQYVPRQLRGRVLRPAPNNYGHLHVHLGKGQDPCVHQLVMLAFVGPPPEGMEVAHNDGKPANNVLSNLRYDTRPGNMRDCLEHGTDIRGEKHPNSKLTRNAVQIIRTSSADPALLAKVYRVSKKHIYAIRSGKFWNCL